MSDEGGAVRALALKDPWAEARRVMVESQLVRRGVKNARVLEAMGAVPRHRFVAPDLEPLAYDDRPLPIGHGQTISQPYMVARATELVAPRPGDRALEVGAGCGYQAAVLASLCDRVYGIEIVEPLAKRANEALTALGYANARVACFDGSGGWPAEAPFDVIVVSAAAPRAPTLLLDQLADGGRLVVPVGVDDLQTLTCYRRRGHDYDIIEDTRCRYVDLVGRYGVGGDPPQA